MYWFFRNILWVVFRIVFRIEVEGKENIKDDERLIICSNHISMLDPIILAITYNKKIYFLAKKELFENPILGWFFHKVGCIPIDRSKADLKSVRESIKILKNNEVLGIFPEGTRVKKIDESNVKDGIGLMANKGKSNILPVFIDTEYKFFGKVRVSYKPIINIEDFENVEKSELNRKITLAAYKEIYNIVE